MGHNFKAQKCQERFVTPFMQSRSSVLLLCASALLLFCSQDAQASLKPLERNIRAGLQSLKTDLLTIQDGLNSTAASLRTANANLELSESEREKQALQLTALSSSLENTLTQLNKSYKDTQALREQVTQERKMNLLFTVVLFGMVILKILGYILYAKGVKLPRWLDILL
jgi:septal ring factor EnvC (AmiA/AmiB activator)